jgi:protein-S-isoprenylcysteine O-methyltransferase Ste14
VSAMTEAPLTVTRYLARWRVPAGFLMAAVVFWLAAPTRVSLIVGGAVAVVGEGLRIWAAGHLRKSSEVTVSGPYRFFAHPLYVGSSIMGAGLAVACNRASVLALVAAYLFVTIAAAVRSEEAHLHERFGARYDSYRGGANVRGPSGATSEQSRADAVRRFSLAQVAANHEYRAVAGLVVAWLLLVFKATYNGSF